MRRPRLPAEFDAGVPRGWHYFWKSVETGPLEEPIIDTIVEHSSRIRSPWSYTLVFQLGGAVADVEEDATAYSNRGAAHNVNINGVWLPHQPIGDREADWTRAYFAALKPYQTGAYVNFLDRDEQEDRVRAAYSKDTYRRLRTIKALYDPDNVFRLNHNFKPSGSGKSAAGAADK